MRKLAAAIILVMIASAIAISNPRKNEQIQQVRVSDEIATLDGEPATYATAATIGTDSLSSVSGPLDVARVWRTDGNPTIAVSPKLNQPGAAITVTCYLWYERNTGTFVKLATSGSSVTTTVTGQEGPTSEYWDSNEVLLFPTLGAKFFSLRFTSLTNSSVVQDVQVWSYGAHTRSGK